MKENHDGAAVGSSGSGVVQTLLVVGLGVFDFPSYNGARKGV